jgi:AraC-like DNA-binding protein
MLPQMDSETSRKYFRGSLTVYLQEVLHGNVGAFAEYIHCPRSILQSWLDGRRMPRLDSLLRISQALNVSIASLFIRERPTSIEVTVAKQAVTIAGQRSVSPSRTGDAIRNALRRAFSEDTPISLSDVARRLGYTTTERLYHADRKLCHRIAARYRQSGKSHWWRKPEQQESAMFLGCRDSRGSSVSREASPVHHIAARLGYSNDSYLQHKFPICVQPSTKGHGEEADPTSEIAPNIGKCSWRKSTTHFG